MPDPPTKTNVLLDVPITFDVGGEVTHAPMVEARVRGVATKRIVDRWVWLLPQALMPLREPV
jgi:hypothetical protein